VARSWPSVGATSTSSASDIDPHQARWCLHGRGALWHTRGGAAHHGRAGRGARFQPPPLMSGIPVSGIGKGVRWMRGSASSDLGLAGSDLGSIFFKIHLGCRLATTDTKNNRFFVSYE
jgi:hypothetical protein